MFKHFILIYTHNIKGEYMNKNLQKFITKNVAQNIKKQRKLVGLKQNEFAVIIEKSTRYIIRLERARFAPTIDIIFKIQDCLNLEINQLIDFKKIKNYRKGG